MSGTYLLKRKNCTPKQNWQADSQWNSIRIGEYVAPAPHVTDYKVVHTPSATTEANKDLTISAQVIGTEFPDSVIIYTDKISFWNEHNPYIKMKRTGGYTYQATIPATEIKDDCFRYNIIVCRQQHSHLSHRKFRLQEFIIGNKGNPLEWNYTSGAYWTTRVVAPDSAIPLLTITDADSRIEAYTLPEWNDLQRTLVDSSPVEKPLLRFRFTPKGENPHYFLRTFVKNLIEERKERVKGCSVLCIRVNRTKALPEGFSAGFVTSDGYTYKSPCPAPSSEGIIRIPLKDLRQTDTALLPIAYPTFLKQYFHPETEIAFLPERIEKLELSMSGNKKELVEIELGNIWLE